MHVSEEMKNYTGISPCPQDIDKYWDDTVSEMKKVDANVELVKVWDLPTVECFDLYFTGIGGARVHAKYARPKNISKPADAVVMFHGYRASFPEWRRLLVFAGQGFCVAAMDCRGQAGPSQDSGTFCGNTVLGHIIRGAFEEDPKKLFYRGIFSDAAQLAGIVMSFDEVNENRVSTFGGSQGGAISLACAALEPGIYKTLPYCPFLCDYKRAWQLGGVAFDEITQYFVRTDPRHETETQLFERLGYIDIQNLAHRIRAKVKMGVGLKDTSCPPLTQFAAFNKITTDKELILYPDYGHADYPEIEDIALKWFLEE